LTQLRALLFDFDGVMADTENVHVAAWQRTFAELGWEVADDICARAAEEDDRTFLAGIFAARQIEGGDVDGWVKRKQALTIAMLAESPRLYPGVADLVRAARRNDVRLAVVSGTWRANVETVLKASGLADDFETIVSKEDVKASKPDPACYRLALKRLKVTARVTVAIEDSPRGIESAHGAGLFRLVAVGHRRPRGDWIGPASYISDLTRPRELLELLGLIEPPGDLKRWTKGR
jgi:beta-phosphoglucomutase